MTADRALGVGAVYQPALHDLFAGEPDLLGVLEVEPQTLWMRRDTEDRPYVYDPAALSRIAALPQHKLVHGVGFPVGGSRVPDPRHLSPFVEFIDVLDAAWASEHLAFNRAASDGGVYDTGFLLPPLQTEAGVAAAVRSIRSVQRHLPVPFAIETGVNYLRRQDWEMEDAAFTAAVAQEADCDILLDLHNIWTNEVNGRQPAAQFMAGLPLGRVREIHVAGGMLVDGYWLDAHSGSIPADVLGLLREFLPEMPALSAVVFEITQTFLRGFGTAAVAREIEKVREIWDPASMTAAQPRAGEAPTPRRPACASPFTPEAWEDSLGAAVNGAVHAGPLAVDPGVAIYRKLISNFRAGILTEAMERTIRLMVAWIGKDATRAALEDYFGQSRPSLFYSDEARNFARYLRGRAPDIPCLEGVAEYELATIDAIVNRRRNVVRLSFRPDPVFAAIAEGRRPDEVEFGNYEIEIVPDADPSDAVGVRDALH